jgi:hypothetical protein
LAVLAIGVATRTGTSPSVRWFQQKWVMFVAVALALLPTSFLGRLKVGGDRNALSFTLYFLLFAVCLMLRDYVAHGRRWLAVLTITGCAVLLIRSQHEWFTTPPTSRLNDAELVHAYVTAHPGEAYFPWNPLSHLMAEHRLYHFDYGLFDRELAGFPLTAEHVRRYMPANPRLVCFPETANMKYVMKYLSEYSRRVTVPELPGFECFEREESR